MNTLNIEVRRARPEDIDSITCIYEQNVLLGTGSFEITPPDDNEMLRRYKRIIDRGFPYLVAEVGKDVVGFCYASEYKDREAYRYTIQDSIYVHPEALRDGIGTCLLTELIRLSTDLGYRQMIAVIGDSENKASIGLHSKLGFKEVGRLKDVGFKFDRWLNSVLMQRSLGQGSTTDPNLRQELTI